MSKSNTILLTLFFLCGSLTKIHAQTSSPVTVADLIPHTFGCYVDYNEYDTATAGSAGVKSHASYTINFPPATNGDIYVLDSIGGGDPSGVHQLFYSFNNPDDLQVYADSAFVADLIPTEIVAGIAQMPDAWVDYFDLSAGGGNSYKITTLSSTVTESGIPANITITITGEYVGIEQVKIPIATYDSAYHFVISAVVAIKTSLGSGSFTSTQDNWLVRGVGIIKTNSPIEGTTILGHSITTVGKEKEMTAYGIAGTAGVSRTTMNAPGINIYPNPASDAVTISLPKPAKQVLLYASDGLMARSFDISGNGPEALLWINDMPNGYYIARIKYADGTMGSTSMIVRH